MKWLRRLFRRRKQEEELEKELSFHLDLRTSDLIVQGKSPEDAQRQARLALGGPEQVKEMCRDAREQPTTGSTGARGKAIKIGIPAPPCSQWLIRSSRSRTFRFGIRLSLPGKRLKLLVT